MQMYGSKLYLRCSNDDLRSCDGAKLIPMKFGLAKPLEPHSLYENQNMTNTSVNLNDHDKILSLGTVSKNPHTLCCGGEGV